MFPFLHSTPTFPEWPVYGARHVSPDVVEEVQNALIALQYHKEVGDAMYECLTEFPRQVCDQMTIEQLYPEARCDTTRELADLAVAASKAGFLQGFRPPRSYFHIRTMQEAGGFLRKNEEGTQCSATDR